MSQRFDGSQQLFRIGLFVLDPDDWLEIDNRLDDCLSEKRRLADAHPDEIFIAEPGSEDAQRETWEMVSAFVTRRFPETYDRQGDGVVYRPNGIRVDPDPAQFLWRAALLVPDDLLLLKKDEAGWRLVAGALSFPSSWRLKDKIGLPIGEVHGPVPGFASNSRNDDLINRMFDNMRADTLMARFNWSVYGDAALFHPDPDETGSLRLGGSGEAAFLRVERQTLRLLPQSGAVLFTVKVIVDPLARLADMPDRFQICERLAGQLENLDAAQLDYKGLSAHRDALVARLRDLQRS
ncbi:MAG: DUF3445 domain-containing protein [Hyphomicrobiaceae bacterium]|nr:DUF3445 domain-containing protein [Hyphomicrobiaceae bacterium]MCC0024968.1 DUF3445 domain-containing protein [Hyphomicrobiaceae bacterium]